jgi:hypothetical protein
MVVGPVVELDKMLESAGGGQVDTARDRDQSVC